MSGPWPDSRFRVSIPWPPHGRRTQAASAALTTLALLAGAATVWTFLGTQQRTAAPRTQLAGHGTIVTMVPGLSQDPDAGPVDRLLMGYFSAINDHGYQQYDRLLVPRLRARLTAQNFALRYASTTDSGARLVGISATGHRVAATVIFISRQRAAAGGAVTSCMFWDITLFLREVGGQLLIGAPPPGYRAYHLACA